MELLGRFVKIPRVGWISSPGPISGVGFYKVYEKGNTMKYSVLLAALLAVSMTACGQKEESAAPEAPAAEVAGEAAIDAGEAAVEASKAGEEAAPAADEAAAAAGEAATAAGEAADAAADAAAPAPAAQ